MPKNQYVTAVDAWETNFLRALASHGNLTKAARSSGVDPLAVLAKRRECRRFGVHCAEAMEVYADVLEQAAYNRAVHGVTEPVLHQGKRVPILARDKDGGVIYALGKTLDEHGELVDRMMPVQAKDDQGQLLWECTTKYSDALLALLLKGRRKDVFTERCEVTGVDGGAIEILDPTARAARVAALIAAANKRSVDPNADVTEEEPAE